MAYRIRYRCPKCESIVVFDDREGKLVRKESVFCPTLGCTGKAVFIWEQNYILEEN